MNLLLTGKSSFIGNSFRRFSFKNENNVKIISLRNNDLSKINLDSVDVILHLAAIVHQTTKIPEENYFKVNTDLAYDLAKKAKEDGVKQFIFFSTIRIYGEYTVEGEKWTEQTPPKPIDPYGRSKLKAEERIMKLNDDEFTVTILRIPMVYGPGVKGNMLKLIRFIEKYHFLPLGGIHNKRSIIYIKNLVDFIDAVIEKNASGIYVAADHELVSTSEIANNIAKGVRGKRYIVKFPLLLQKLLKLFWKSKSQKLFGNLELDNSKSLKRLDFTPKYTFEQGMNEMMEWYNQQKPD